MSENFKKLLPVELTDEEKQRAGFQLANKLKELNDIGIRKQAFNSAIGAESKGVQKEVQTITDNINTGYEQRYVECTKVLFPVEGLAKLIRLDTGETISARAMFEDEYQSKLDFLTEEEAKAFEADFEARARQVAEINKIDTAPPQFRIRETFRRTRQGRGRRYERAA